MEIIAVSYNAHAINSGNYRTTFVSSINLETSILFSKIAGEPPEFSGKTFGAASFFIKISVQGGANLYTAMDQINGWFDPYEANLKTFIIENGSGGTQWYVNATPVGYPKWEGGGCTIQMSFSGVWKSVIENSQLWNVSASGTPQNVTTLGNKKALPRIVITPKGAKTGGYAYKRFILLWNNVARSLPNYYLDVTGQTGKALDTATLTTAKMQADGDDIRIVVDGKEVDYWLTGMDTATTGIHTSEISLSPKIELTLLTQIAATGAVPTIYVKKTAANLAALKKLANVANKVIALNTGANIEIFKFTSVNTTLYTITGCVREQKTFGKFLHVVGTTIRWIEHDIWLVYGNATAEAMVVDALKKTMLNLTNSTNLSWAWSEYYQDGVQRPQSWSHALSNSRNTSDPTNKSNAYGGNQTADVDPATHLGFAIKSFKTGNAQRPETATAVAQFYDPTGFTAVVLTGERYRNSAGWVSVILQKMAIGMTKFIDAFTEVTPTVIATWQNATVLTGTKSMGGTYQYLKFLVSGSIAAGLRSGVVFQANFEVNAGLAITKDSTLVPTITVGSESNNYTIDEQIENTLTGEVLEITYPCAIDESVTIDVENRLAYHSSGVSVLQALKRSGNWLTLDGGVANPIVVTDVGIANVDHAFYWDDRIL